MENNNKVFLWSVVWIGILFAIGGVISALLSGIWLFLSIGVLLSVEAYVLYKIIDRYQPKNVLPEN